MLTDKECRAAKADTKPLKLFDAHGLFLHVSVTGHKSWRLKYRMAGREKTLTIGPYPSVRLSEARELSGRARELRRAGTDPTHLISASAQHKGVSLDHTQTFATVARDWHELQRPQWKARHADDVLASLENDLFPELGSKQLADIRPQDLVALLRKVQKRGALETAFRLLQRISAVYQYAIACEIVTFNPAATIAPALQPVVKRKQRALLSIPRVRAFLTAYEAAPGYPATKLASRLLALTAARPGVVRMAEPHEFEDLDGPEPIWRIPAAKMKLKQAESEQDAFDFIVSLSTQAVELVRVALGFAGKRKYLFPSTVHSHRPFTDNALNKAYRAVPKFESKHVPHGWRSSFSTIMNERALNLGQAGDRAIIDPMLTHVPAGMPHCAAHGLRKAAARRAAEMGASNQELKAVGGWTSDQQVSVYTEAANQKKMAKSAMAPVIQFDLDSRKP